MINVAVINLKTLLKKLMKIIIVVVMIAMIIKFASIVYSKIKSFDFEKFKVDTNMEMLKNNIALFDYFESSEKNGSELKKILVAELAVFSGAEEEIMEQENMEEVLEFEDLENQVEEQITETEVEGDVAQIEIQTNAQVPEKNIETVVLEANNKKDVFTDIYKTVQIKNESKYALTEEMVRPDSKYSDNKNIIIYHTHTCESYTPSANSQYVATGNYRTTDLNFSVARVGSELANYLAGKGYTAIHEKAYHDYPAYSGSYTRSLATIKNMLSVYDKVDAVFDIHRDALRK